MDIWAKCLERLKEELPTQEFSMWIRPLQCDQTENEIILYAQNHFILDWVRDKYRNTFAALLEEFSEDEPPQLKLNVQARRESDRVENRVAQNQDSVELAPASIKQSVVQVSAKSSPAVQDAVGSVTPLPVAMAHKNNLNPNYKFDSFVEGKSNQLARAAASQVADNPGQAYNPLFIYGGTGLGKTHLLHAVGHGILESKPNAKIVYMHSERFVQDMVKALQNNAIEDFKRFYRSVDALLIDDIQFFANKDRSQEEFFHTFNALLEGNQQIILTSDRYLSLIHI